MDPRDVKYVSLPFHLNLNLTPISLKGLTAQGNSVTLQPGSASFAAIDTGTTLVGGPASVIAQLYAQIPNSAPGSGDYDGYYTYPCSTAVNVTLAFGGQSWSVSPDDFRLAQLSSTQCLGAFFELSGQGTPAWIVGDTFLVCPFFILYPTLVTQVYFLFPFPSL